MRRLTEKEKDFICNQMNPAGSNHRGCNFFRLLEESETHLTVEVGYWITYIGCRPKYDKTIIGVKKDEI